MEMGMTLTSNCPTATGLIALHCTTPQPFFLFFHFHVYRFHSVCLCESCSPNRFELWRKANHHQFGHVKLLLGILARVPLA